MTVDEYCGKVRQLARQELDRVKADMPWMVEQLALAYLENSFAELPSEEIQSLVEAAA